MKTFLRWIALVALMAVAGWYGYDTGIVAEIIKTDISKLSIVIVTLLVIGTAIAGLSAWRVKAETTKRMENRLFVGWFLAEVMMVLGLAGTVVGFIVLFQGNFNDVNFDSPETVQAVIIAIASGMGISLYTTIVGIFSALLLKLQLVNVEVSLNTTDEDSDTTDKAIMKAAKIGLSKLKELWDKLEDNSIPASVKHKCDKCGKEYVSAANLKRHTTGSKCHEQTKV